jgi:hypothetical protein
MIRQCVICGKGFKCSPSDKKATCGEPGCVRINKVRTHQGKRNAWNEESRQKISNKGQTANLKKGTPAAKKSPIAGSFETNQNAKEWVLVDPEGKEYKIRNLSLWAKNNSHLFDRTPAQIVAGFKQIKRYYEGKTKRTVTSYFGWTLKDWGD